MRCKTLAFWTALAAFAANVTSAEPVSETLFSHKHWQVEFVTFDDGSVACLAEVDAVSDSFSIWAYADHSIRLQFYSTSWEFGEGDTADLEVQIDSIAPWSLTKAELYRNSVLFDLPDSDESVNFVLEVAGGNRLYLRSADGSDVINYSLAGSSAAINALVDCGNAIAGGDTNPFD